MFSDIVKKCIPDSIYLRLLFYRRLGKKLNLKNPQTFNEKLQWLKLYDRRPEYTIMADKYLVKDYVANVIGEEYIIPTLGVWEHFDDINFEKLPDRFVLKCTHDCGGLIICKDKSKLDKVAARCKIENCLRHNYYWPGREWPYKKIKPRIIAEKCMVDNSNYQNDSELRDYKFFCFNGKVECFKIDFDRFVEHKANYYNSKTELLKFGEQVCPPDFSQNLKIPSNIDKMIYIAEKLSKGYPFIRVDLYNINEKIYFGELTFYPASGFGPFIPEKWDMKLGECLKLPTVIV